MTKHITSILLFCFSVGVCAPSITSAASEGTSMSVTPTLFEMAASPSQSWSSSVKVINNNRFNLTVYASVVNFAPQGETGEGKFLPVFENFTEGTTLAEWIDITSEPIVIDAETSIQVPFTVHVPEDASPGGHFAAILIGTRPPGEKEKFKIQTSQIVTSLFFVKVAGDVVEEGTIREFRTTKSFVQEPKVNFELRFENKGNVHIQPQGEIRITNMWGKERGIIPINHQTHFGNVLPESIRKFEFTWKGERQFSDIGRYKAIATLAYGDENRKFETSATYFWVVPIKSVVTVLFAIICSAWFILWAIRSYIRRMLALSGYQYTEQEKRPLMREGDVLIKKKTSIQSPVVVGVTDLKAKLSKVKETTDLFKTLVQFVWTYKIFFGSLTILGFIVFLLFIFVSSVGKDARDYEVIIGNPEQNVTLSSEEILYEQNKSEETDEDSNEEGSTEPEQSQPFELVIVNSSDTPGAAANLQKSLEPVYEVSALKSDFNESKDKTVIVYHRSYQEEALVLSKLLNGALLSALPEDSEEQLVTIYIGNDYTSE